MREPFAPLCRRRSSDFLGFFGRSQGMLFTLAFLFGGVFINGPDIPIGWKWMYWCVRVRCPDFDLTWQLRLFFAFPVPALPPHSLSPAPILIPCVLCGRRGDPIRWALEALAMPQFQVIQQSVFLPPSS